MTISIDEKVCKENNLQPEEVLALLIVKMNVDVSELFVSLEERNMIVKDVFNKYIVKRKYDDIVSEILLDSDKNKQPLERLEKLALKLAKIFPSEKKAGTCHYFRGNKRENTLRLKKFFKIYGKYTDEQILDAAKRYVESFNGNYTYMRILKYFIWKDEVKIDSEGERYVESVSDLANWIENVGQTNSTDSNWTANLK